MLGVGSLRVPEGIRHLAFSEEMPHRERVLAAARLFLAISTLVAIYLDPAEPKRYTTWAYFLLTTYVIYSAGLFVLIFLIVLHSREKLTRRFSLGVHAVDLLWPPVLALFTEGTASPFYLLFFFVLIAAAYRWGFWETLATTGAAISLLSLEVIIVRSGSSAVWHSLQGAFDLHRIIMRITYLFLMGLLIGYLGEEEKRLRTLVATVARIIAKVQAERGLANTMRAVFEEILHLFGAHQVLLVVREGQSARSFLWQSRRESEDTEATIQVSEMGSPEKARYLFPMPCHSLRATRCGKAEQGDSFLLIALDSQGRRMRNPSCTLPADFCSAHAFRSVLTVSFAFEDDWSGRLFVLKRRSEIFKKGMLTFLQTLVYRVGPAVYSAYLSSRLRSRAGALARAGLARELHDGVVQFLIGLEMHMEGVGRATPTAPPRMIEELTRTQQLLRDEVASLRDLMQRAIPLEVRPEHLLDYLRDTVNKFRLETAISASFVSDLRGMTPPSRVCRELVRIVQEALVNVRKHSGARSVLVQLSSEDPGWKLVVTDDGCGFGFSGRRAHAELDALRLGPRIIKERVTSLGGELTIESKPGGGARLEILIPD